MSKSLEALENIKMDMEYVTRLDFVEPIVRGQVQQDLYKIYHRETKELELIEKELKALEIIKRNPFAFAALTICLKDSDSYEKFKEINPKCYTKEEFDLLKEIYGYETIL